jgi:putative ABC transport system permease protein
MLDGLTQDVRYAARTLRKRPGFAVAAVVTLALGVGANTGIFSIVYGILLRPLPYRDAERLVLVEVERDVGGTREPMRIYFPLPELAMFRARFSSFESVAFYATDEGVLSNDRGAERVDFATVSDTFFSTLGGGVRLGRALGSSDDLSPALVISERVWRRAFSGSPDVLGQRVTLNSTRGDGSQRATWRRIPFTIVGVAEATFQFPRPQIDVWTPAGLVRTVNPRCCSFLPVARLKPRATLNQASGDAQAVANTLSSTNARAYAGLRARVVGLHEHLVRAVRSSLLILLAAVGLVLIVACANVMNLLLARNVARAREISVRVALGASRGRLVTQSVVESGLLATLGGTAGMVLAAGMVETLRRLEPAELPRLDAVRVDGPVLIFAVAAATLVAVVTGLFPTLRSDPSESLRTEGKGATIRPSGTRVRRALMIAELAVSVVLLVGAILLGRSLVRLMNTDVGVETNRVATASLSLALDRELSSAQQIALVDRVLERIRALPGVKSVGIGTSLPPRESRILLTLRGANAIDYQAAAIPSSPGYFSALGIRLLKGRFFTDADDGDHPPVMIMSADTARHFFGGDDPIGRTLSLPIVRDGATRQGTIELVGIIGDVKYSGLDRAPDNAIYRPFTQQPWPHAFLVARVDGDPTALGMTLQRQIADVDRAISVSAVSTLSNVVSEAAAQQRFRTLLFAALAGLALALAAVGLYGVVAYSVSQRTTEIGIRMALGATASDVVKMIVCEAMWLAVFGVAIGVAVAFALARTLASLLYGVAPTDTASFVFASGSMLFSAVLASYIPARRAIGIEPAIALRAE